KDGKITIKGKEITSILVDGEKFFSDDPQVAAKNIPADYVQKVQAYERQSDQAQFTGIDDGNEETVINLSFKPGMKKGWFGRFTAGGGMDAVSNSPDFRYDNTFNVNYFKDKDQMTILGSFNNVNNMGFSDFGGGSPMMMGGGRGGFSFMGGGVTQSISPGINFVKKVNAKLSIGGSYSYARSDRDIEQTTYRENIMANGSSQYYSEEERARMISNQHRFNSEIRYEPNEDNELVVRPSFSFNSSDNSASSQFRTMDSTYQTVGDSAWINRGWIENTSETSSFSARLRADFRHRFNKPRRTFSVEVDGGLNANTGSEFNQSFNEYTIRSGDSVDQRISNNGNRYNYSTQLAYTEPLIRDFTMELRYTFSNSEDKTERLAFDNDGIGYTIMDSVYSNDYGNSFFNQRFEIRIQKNVEKYRYSFGLGVFPANSVSHLEGRSDVRQKVFNFAPQAQFRYRFSKQSSLNFRYNGQTSQPSMTQLQPVPDNSDPLNIRLGNPNLKPEFTHRFRAMYDNYFENLSSIFSAIMINMTQNKISNTTFNDASLIGEGLLLDSAAFRPGVRVMMSDNIGFVYTGNAMAAYSTPILSDKITLSSTSNVGLGKSKSVIDKMINELNSFSFYERLRVTYRIETFDVSLNGQIMLNDAKYTLQPERNNVYYTTSGGADFNWQIIPGKLTLSSDVSFSTTTGYSDGYNPKFTTWNAQLAWNIGKSNEGQLRLRINDILNDNNNTRRTTAESYIEDITYNTVPRYMILSFTYNLNSNKGADAPQQNGVGVRRWHGPHGH
ncbi:MAG: outer membrane beta-barrel family protein, partial [Bacteroidales bacterium]|nr:outer membrane beta-barrel family protein [Bacteroidales bacterium]